MLASQPIDQLGSGSPRLDCIRVGRSNRSRSIGRRPVGRPGTSERFFGPSDLLLLPAAFRFGVMQRLAKRDRVIRGHRLHLSSRRFHAGFQPGTLPPQRLHLHSQGDGGFRRGGKRRQLGHVPELRVQALPRGGRGGLHSRKPLRDDLRLPGEHGPLGLEPGHLLRRNGEGPVCLLQSLGHICVPLRQLGQPGAAPAKAAVHGGREPPHFIQTPVGICRRAKEGRANEGAIGRDELRRGMRTTLRFGIGQAVGEVYLRQERRGQTSDAAIRAHGPEEASLGVQRRRRLP